MAIRLSVIMIQSAPPTAAAGRTAEAVVGELIGLNGIDLTLVGPLAEISKSSTDQLTLESLAGDVAVLDWQSPSEIVMALSRLGFSGQRTAHENDPGAQVLSANLRRIYAFNLAAFSGPEDILQALSGLNANRQVRTFSLGLTPNSASQNMSPSVRPSSQQQPESQKKEQATLVRNLDNSPPHPPSEDASTPPERGDPLNLDDLLDQLDQMDP